MESPSERLEQALANRRAAKRADGRRTAADAEAERRRQALDDAQKRHHVEDRDVQRLERLSLTRIMSALHGSHATDLEREQGELDAAAYAVAAAQAQLEAAEGEAHAAAAARAQFGDVDAEYEGALAAQQAWIEQHDPARAAELNAITERAGALRAEHREVVEAIEAGDLASEALRHAYDRLGSADSLSAWDTFLGGGMLVSAAKHNRLDEAGQLLVRVDAALDRFGQELADLHVSGLPAVNVGSLERNLDIFFDNIFSDLGVRRRIKETIDTLVAVSRHVDETVHALVQRGTAVETELTACRSERERVLTG